MAKTKTMTEGTPWKLLLGFAAPIMIGQMVQLFYSMVDTKIVGATLGETALAAVGSVSTLYNLTNGFSNGLTMGFSVIMAMHFGRKDTKGLRNAYASAILLSVGIMLVISGLLLGFLQPVLQWLQVPEAELAMAGAYIRILIIGLVVTVMYNMFANSMRAIGDSITPLIFLVVAALLNVGLDYFFILVVGMSVDGAALATVLAQLLSVILCLIRIMRKYPILHPEREDWVPDGHMVSELLKSGCSMALMNSLVGAGSVIMQSAINGMGEVIIVANTAARKVMELVMMPGYILAMAMATFSGQNYGAGRLDRVRTGLKSITVMAAIWCAVGLAAIWIFGGRLMGFMASTQNADIIYWGFTYMKVSMTLDFVCLEIGILRNTMQGFGDRFIPVVSSLIELAGKMLFGFWLAPMFGYWCVIVTEPIIWCIMIIPLIVKTVIVLRRAGGEPPVAARLI